MAAIPGNVPERPRAGAPREDGAGPNHLVITVHGIRTYGGWQTKLEQLLTAAEPGIIVRNFQFGYFSSVAFLVPFLRWIVARQFRKYLVHAIRSMPPDARIDVVAHSFGTYLAASALKAVPRGRRINTMILAGSVLRPTFPWFKYQEAGTLGRVVNECGLNDNVLLLCQATALMLGMAGRVGFQTMIGDDFANRYFRGGHALYFDPDQQFIREHWIPLLTTSAPIPAIDNRDPLTPLSGGKLFLLNNMHVFKIAGTMVALLVIVWFPIDWSRKVAYKKRAERERYTNMLINASQIPLRDPAHDRELLFLDMKAGDDLRGSQTPGEHVFVSDPVPDEDEIVADNPDWLQWIVGASDKARIARHRHALANSQFVSNERSNTRDLSKAKLNYKEAIRNYESIKDAEPIRGSYALCLLGYGLLLTEKREYEEAIKTFGDIRTKVFPIDLKTGERPSMPPSLQIDSLCYQAAAHKGNGDWKKAEACLKEAETLAKDDKDFQSYVWNELAWLRMERLEVDGARYYFDKAKEACEALTEDEYNDYRTRLYHIRHGLAMTERLHGKSDASYEQYDQIVQELSKLLRDDVKLTPKKRRELRDRLVNSLERRADVRFFARQMLRHEDDAPLPGFNLEPRQYRKQMKNVAKQYQETIDCVDIDDTVSLIRLLYKKTIAQCLIDTPPVSATANKTAADNGAPPAVPDQLEPIDAEFATAERAFHSLSPEQRKELRIYRGIATHCRTLHEGPDKARRKALADLRAVAAEYAARCEKLKREHVEILLVAHEMLLETEPNRVKVANDASTMMGVLGTTTNVAAHRELQPYIERFNRIAGPKLTAPETDEPVLASRVLPRESAMTSLDADTYLVVRLPWNWTFLLRRGDIPRPYSTGSNPIRITTVSEDRR
jgi:tetratricopeptide (TPR) repeat protein